MADNVAITAGAGTTVATDDVGGVHYQRVKVAHGADGSATDVSTSSPLPVGGAAADDAAASGNPVPIGGVYQSTVDEVDADDIGRVRMSARRGLVTVADQRLLSLSSSAPVPSGSDLTNTSGGALVAGDFAIRDASAHVIVIPMHWYRSITIQLLRTTLYSGGSWSKMTVTVRGHFNTVGSRSAKLCEFDWDNDQYVSIGPSAVGQGGVVGAATSATMAYYSVPALADPWAFVSIAIQADNAPTDGDHEVAITRRS